MASTCLTDRDVACARRRGSAVFSARSRPARGSPMRWSGNVAGGIDSAPQPQPHLPGRHDTKAVLAVQRFLRSDAQAAAEDTTWRGARLGPAAAVPLLISTAFRVYIPSIENHRCDKKSCLMLRMNHCADRRLRDLFKSERERFFLSLKDYSSIHHRFFRGNV